MTTASPDPHVGLPSEETIARAINLAARAMQRQFAASGSEEEIEAAIWQYLGPAFEAKDAEIERIKGEVELTMMSLIFVPAIRAAIEALPEDDDLQPYRARAEAALSAEAKLAQAVEALARAKDEIVRTADDLSMHSPAVKLVEEIAAIIGQPALNSRAIVREAASAAARGETR